jgi:hypothetical protein
MPKLNNDIQEDLKKNRPTLLPSIVNLVISVIFIIVITIVKFTTDEISLGLYIGFITVLVMFTLASFINGYLAKKQKTKMLKSYDKETELILEYLQYSKKFHRFEENEKITYKINIKETTEVEKFSYNSEKSSLGFPDTECSMMSIGIGFAGVTINPEDGQIISLAGLLPKSIWLGKKLTPPTAKKATLYLDINGIDLRAKTYFQILR